MGRVKFQVATRTGRASQHVAQVVQADGECRPGQLASARMARVLSELLDAGAQAADRGLCCEVSVLVYPADTPVPQSL